jgi:hypothetical protein
MYDNYCIGQLDVNKKIFYDINKEKKGFILTF